MQKFYTVLLLLSFIQLGSAQITADFTVNETEGCEVLQASFLDQSISTAGNIVDWQWTLGNASSSLQNPGALFNTVGSFDICLTVEDNLGNSETLCKENFVHVYANPIADFTFPTDELCSPADINFNDLSTTPNGSITNWTWDVGGTSNIIQTSDPNQIINTTYGSGGNYSLSLFITDEKGCTNIVTKNDAITVRQSPTIDFSYQSESDCALPFIVSFSNNNIENNTSYLWDFGNGDTFEGPTPPNMTYTTDGTYSVKLTASNNGCVAETTSNILVNTDPDFNFTIAPNQPCIGNRVRILNDNNSAYDSIVWEIESLGNLVTTDNLEFFFNAPGCYDISGTIYVGSCTYDYTFPNCITVIDEPIVNINIDSDNFCSIPADLDFSSSLAQDANVRWRIFYEDETIEVDENEGSFTAEEFGDYTFRLIYVLNDCIFSYERTITIAPYEVLLPEVGPSGCIPLDVSLSDSIVSAYNTVSWEWTVGPSLNISSNDPNPSFTVTETGQYNVQLIAQNALGCIDSVNVPAYVRAGTPPTTDFSFTPEIACASEIFVFTDLSSDNANEFWWNPNGGDGFYGEEIQDYMYQDTGFFDLQHVALHNGCPGDTVTFEDAVYINAPVSLFEIRYDCENPYDVKLINNSIGADTFYWDVTIDDITTRYFQDSFFVSLQERGTYYVELFTENYTTECDFIKSDSIIITDPIASFALDTTMACNELETDITDLSTDAFLYYYFTDGADIDNDTIAEPILHYETPGAYEAYLIIEDIHECRDTFYHDSIYIDQVVAIPLVDPVVCIPDSIVFADGSTSLFGTINQWDWNLGDGIFTSTKDSTSFFIDQETNYLLDFNIMNSWGCTDTLLDVEITSVRSFIDFEADSTSCTQDFVNFTNLSTGNDISGYVWDFGDGNFSSEKDPQHRYEAEGNYTVCLTVVEALGCERTVCKEQLVSVINPIADFTADVTEADCPPLLVNFTNNSSFADSYTWDFGDNSGQSTLENPSHIYNSVDNFDVILVAMRGDACADTLIIPEYIQITGPKGNFSMTSDSSCLPLTVTFIGDSDSEYEYVWDFGNGEVLSPPANQSTDTVIYQYNEIGSFTPKLFLKNETGCIRTFSGNPIVVNDMELDMEYPKDPFCGVPQQITLTNLSTSSDPTIEYTWEVSNHLDTYYYEDESPVFNIVKAGIFDIKLKGELENCKDEIIASEAIIVGSQPIADFLINADKTCQDQLLNFVNNSSNEVGEIVGYIWDFGDTNMSTDTHPSHQYAENLAYEISLNVETEYGCLSQISNPIDVLEASGIEIVEPPVLCEGETTSLSANIINNLAGNTFTWNDSPSLSCTDCLEPTAEPDTVETFVFTITQENGCVVTDSVDLFYYTIEGPKLQLVTDPIICSGDTTTVTITNYNNDYSYTWEGSNNQYDETSEGTSIIAFPEDSINFQLSVTNNLGCVENAEISILIDTLPSPILNDDKIYCEGSETNLAVLYGNDPIWSGPNLSCTDCLSPEIEVSLGGTSYFVDITSDAGCPYTDTIAIFGIAESGISAGEDATICLGETISLTADAIGEIVWSPALENSAPNELITKVSPDSSMYFYIQATIDECIIEDSVYVNVLYKTDISSTNDTICPEDIAILEVEGNATSYRWEGVDNDFNEDDVNSIELSPSATSQFLVIGSRGTCISDTSFSEIIVHDEVVAELEEKYEVFANQNIQINVDYDKDKNYVFEWLPFSGLSCYDCDSPFIRVTDDADYQLIITDADTGCQLDKEISIRYNEECTEQAFYLPNIFSPNGDGQNDFALVFPADVNEFISLAIYDRWGNQMFATEDPEQGWDGNFQGQEAIPAVYVMKITAICLTSGLPYVFYGDIVLAR
jgi:gliding motility-associated-like protein